jgi:hypothetical protein
LSTTIPKGGVWDAQFPLRDRQPEYVAFARKTEAYEPCGMAANSDNLQKAFHQNGICIDFGTIMELKEARRDNLRGNGWACLHA